MEIRPARADDWPSIYPIFAAIVAEGRTYAYPEGLSSDEATGAVDGAAAGAPVVAVDGRTVLGTAKTGPHRPGRGAHVATASFMVDPAAQGRGVGRALRHDGMSVSSGGCHTTMVLPNARCTNDWWPPTFPGPSSPRAAASAGSAPPRPGCQRLLGSADHVG